MKKRQTLRRQKSKEKLNLNILENKKEIGGNKRSAYMSGCFMVVVTLAISQLQLGKINDAIYISAGSFLIIPMLNQLAKLVWDE